MKNLSREEKFIIDKHLIEPKRVFVNIDDIKEVLKKRKHIDCPEYAIVAEFAVFTYLSINLIEHENVSVSFDSHNDPYNSYDISINIPDACIKIDVKSVMCGDIDGHFKILERRNLLIDKFKIYDSDYFVLCDVYRHRKNYIVDVVGVYASKDYGTAYDDSEIEDCWVKVNRKFLDSVYSIVSSVKRSNLKSYEGILTSFKNILENQMSKIFSLKKDRSFMKKISKKKSKKSMFWQDTLKNMRNKNEI